MKDSVCGMEVASEQAAAMDPKPACFLAGLSDPAVCGDCHKLKA